MILEGLLFALTLFIAFFYFKRDKNLPPGPPGIPILGNMPVLYSDQAQKLREKYGDVFMVQTGTIKTVFIADFKKAKEAFSRIELSSRVDWKILLMYEEEIKNGEPGGVMLSSGLRWHNTRRFLLRNLRDMGMGKSKLEGTILREIESLVENFKSLTKEPSELPFSINVTILNVIWQLVASKRYEFSSIEVRDLMRKVNEAQDIFFAVVLCEYFPFVRTILPEPIFNFITRRNLFLKATKNFMDEVQPVIDEHLDKLNPNDPADLMDEYLIEMKEKKSKEFSHFSNQDLVKTTFDLFVAGNDTTATMTRWILLYMAKFPHIQSKIQALIDEVVPNDRLPGLDDRERLAYLDAAINEIQRHTTLAPFGIFRMATQDFAINGYTIPKGALVQSTNELNHKDPAYWEEPEKVDPTRFLDSNGKFVSTREGFLPFGLGRRQCLGEQFARMELFLITAALLQNFTFSPPEGEEVDITPRRVPTLNRPKKNQKLQIRLRH